MKILLWYWGRRAGGARYALEVAKVLSKNPNVELYYSISRQMEFYREFEELNLPCVNVNTYNSLLGMFWQVRNLYKYCKQLASFIKNEKIDIVYSPMTHIWNFLISPIFKLINVPYVLTMHDAITHVGDHQYVKNIILKLELKSTTGCISLTQAVKKQINTLYNYPCANICVIPHGAFTYGESHIRHLPDTKQINIIFYGRILKYKGLDLLLEAFAILHSNNNKSKYKYSLEIWGDGDLSPYRNKINTIVVNGGDIKINNRWIDESEIYSIFKNADICALPYIEASQSGVAAIAFASGVPIVATPQPGLIEQVLGFGGLVSDEVNGQSYAECLTKILNDPVLYEELSSQCIKSANDIYGWLSVGNKVYDCLNQYVCKN